MSGNVIGQTTFELAALLDRLILLEDRLLSVIREKLEAMRRSDVEAMLITSREEGRVVVAISSLDAARRQLVQRLGGAVGLVERIGTGSPTLRQLAGRLDAPGAELLMEKANALRERMLRVAEANRVVEQVSREILDHFKTLFAVMLKDETEAPTYSAAGQVGPPSGARVLDSVA